MSSAYDIPEIEGLYRFTGKGPRRFTRCIGEALRGYPVFDYVLNGKYEAETVSRIFAAELRCLGDRQVSLAADEHAEAVALFTPPGFCGVGTFRYLLAGGLGVVCRLGLAATRRLSAFEEYSMALKRKYADEDSWYVLVLAVSPASQNKGLISELVKPMLAYFDRTGQQCYLETSDPRNVPRYEHYGFAVAETGQIPGTEIVHYAMVRRPKALL